MKPAPVQPTLFDPPKGDCPQCEGTGKVDRAPFNLPQYGVALQPWTVCPNCGGSGSPDIPF